MIGYKNEKYFYFGWAAAKLDDLLNFIPARITALILLLSASIEGQNEAKRSFLAIRLDASKLDSINSGYPESAMAGALNIKLAGPRQYGKQHFDGQWIGGANEGSTADVTDEHIQKSLIIYTKALLILAAILIIFTAWLANQ